jgi:hypothetical protein
MSKFAERAERAAQICAAVATAAFLSSALVYLYLGRWTVTSADFWWIYEIYLNHSWLESALLKINHHSIFFPSLIFMADLRFLHGDQQLLFFVGMILLFCTAILLLVPLWRDKTVGFTAKLVGTLVVIVGNFWMGRASIMTVGGSLCLTSLAIGGALLAFLWLPITRIESARFLKAWFIVIGSAFVASFSFGAGLAVWPTLLLLGWSLRLPWRSLAVLLAGGFTAILVYVLLPGDSGQTSWRTLSQLLTGGMGIQRLCGLLGAPFPFAISNELAFSLLSLTCGALGLVFAGLAVVPRVIRRDLGRSKLELISLALVIFDLLVMVIIIVGRDDNFRETPSEVSAPRYFFWSSLFWAGLLLFAIQRAEPTKWLRWPVFLIALTIPIVAFPSHYREGVSWRKVNILAESCAASLINGVRDANETDIIKELFGPPELVYRVAAQLRAQRLDMFADGLQDWIGLPETSLFAGRHKSERLKGKCHVDGLVQCENGAFAAKVTGWLKPGHAMPRTLVIVDPTGVIRGVARSHQQLTRHWMINKPISEIFYRGKFQDSRFFSYITNYDAGLRYAVRSADDGVLSDEKIVVDTPVTSPSTP